MNKENIKTIAKYGLGAMLITAGIGHLSFVRKEFQAQVPDWVPLDKDDTVVYSGIAEIALGTAHYRRTERIRIAHGKDSGFFFYSRFSRQYCAISKPTKQFWFRHR